MNAQRFLHFRYYLLDLHNLKVRLLNYDMFTLVFNQVEGVLGVVANPLNPRRMEIILEDTELAVHDKKLHDEDFIRTDKDDVTICYYREPCNCSARSTCSTKTCSCVEQGFKCHINYCKCKNILKRSQIKCQ